MSASRCTTEVNHPRGFRLTLDAEAARRCPAQPPWALSPGAVAGAGLPKNLHRMLALGVADAVTRAADRPDVAASDARLDAIAIWVSRLCSARRVTFAVSASGRRLEVYTWRASSS